MKKLILLLSLVSGFNSYAKVGDFNSLIVENSQAQKELHKNLKYDLETTRLAYQKQAPQNFIVDRESNSINVPTSKSILTFRKEKQFYRASETQQQKRLAEEINQAQ